MAWRVVPLLAFALLVAASASAMQQVPARPDPLPAEPTSQDASSQPPAPQRGISAQAANEAAVAQLPPASQNDQNPKDAQEAAQQVPSKPADVVSEPAVQATDAAATVSPDAATPADPVPVTVGATRGVLFRIFPPALTSLPAETAVAEPPAVEAGSQAKVAGIESAPPEAASTPVQPQPSYLLGTIHFGSPEEQGVDYAILEKALASVDTFVNEADLDEAWKSSYDDYRWLSPAQPLSAMIGKDSYAMARSLLPNIREQDLVRMKPWSVLALLEARGETGGDTTMDARLQRIASASGKKLVHLETLQQQLQALDCVPATEHALVLDERLRAPWILRDESAAAMKYYRTRNLDAWLADIDHMYGLSYAGKAIEQRSRHCLLEERNTRWLGQLETLFQDGSNFVAVGSIHLVGPQGLLASLRRDGYRVEEVPL